MLSRSAPFLLVSTSLACLVAGLGSCTGDTVVRTVDAGRADRYASTKPSSSGGSGGAASDSRSAVGGAAGDMSSSAGGGGSSQTGGQSQAGSGGTGGTSASNSSARGGGGGRSDASSSTVVSSTGRIADASVVADAPGGEVGPVACNDKTSNDRLGVYYYTGSPAAQTQDVQIHLALVNFTALTARLSQATVRYWFTDEGAGTPNILTMYYTPTTLAKISTRFLPATPPRAGADTVLEFSFTPNPDAGASFVETTEFNFAFHKDGYSGTYNQANDYSFDSSLSKSFGPNPKITAYLAGQLAWGCEPPVAASTDAGTD
jgi:hypothetical protein